MAIIDCDTHLTIAIIYIISYKTLIFLLDIRISFKFKFREKLNIHYFSAYITNISPPCWLITNFTPSTYLRISTNHISEYLFTNLDLSYLTSTSISLIEQFRSFSTKPICSLCLRMISHLIQRIFVTWLPYPHKKLFCILIISFSTLVS